LPIPITLATGFYNSLHYHASRDGGIFNDSILKIGEHLAGTGNRVDCLTRYEHLDTIQLKD